MANTFRENLNNLSHSIKENIKDLLLEHSKLIYDDLNAGSTNFFVIGIGDYRWQELTLEGKRLQSKIRNEYNTYIEIVRCLIDEVHFCELNGYDKTVLKNVDQNDRCYIKNTEQAYSKVLEAFLEIDHLLDSLHSTEDETLLIADTCALLTNTKIETWKFDEFGEFCVVLTPAVLSELDSHKVNHRNEFVREKSNKLIRQIKEYRRRGSILSGVKINDNIHLRSIAVEPVFENSLPWLDENNNDDRFIATAFEIIKKNIRSAVYIVTTDINMQNKAENACLPFLEPPKKK
ncbi:putative ATPase related to phosphate starvation-inducible protein PhoH [Limihaloglobus sulfuriphilus]|uniref:Putative ATPase related to phosphate starvation-inducible protein PhoH n=1 Tax=Limihaloglobus sulfuriphilus TaxID=1851148 RepID=A0A1Q2MDI6_9BACT|nr:PIN domain-containing protein [Limihaloglobus sulfuriphilus]AQQ70751.1 putative ATPase related to phosphate starvation-inducible protein PhoH [Limihaloglobus sulfuriphilus]